MLRQVSSRNHRSKGFKLKNALQICLLVVITIWLLFQVKHSYDKKNEFEDHRNAHSSSSSIKHDGGDGGDRHELFKFGRKDLPGGGDVRIEDEASEDELEHELLLKRGGESEAIDEQDQGKDDDGGSGAPENEDESGAFEDAENAEEGGKEGEGVPEERGDHSREARERSFNGDNVASAVAHEDRSSENAESKVAGGGSENLTSVESASGGGGGLKDREVTPSNADPASSNSTAADERNDDPKPRVDPTTNSNVDGNQTDRATESPTNATTASNNNQIELSTTNLTVPERNETTNLGSGSGSDSAHDRISGDGEFDTSSTASPATTSEEEGEGRVEFQDTTRDDMAEEETREAAPRAKIEERAKTGEEAAVLE